MADQPALSRRERQIMDIIYARGAATVNDVVRDLPDPPTRIAVRTLLRILEHKGHVRHKVDGRRFVYEPVRPRAREGQSAMRRVVKVFFEGSLLDAVTSHMSDPAAQVSPEELKRLEHLIKQARKREEG
jgi:BlaI family transcriptional regulator, penicillinase repressor